jgi:hypothetical protein
MKRSAILTAIALAFSATLSEAAITVVSTSTGLPDTVRNTGAGGSSFIVSFDAGATADAIVLSLSSESNASAGQVSISYAGFAFTPVIDHIGAQPSVWLLNLRDTTYISGSADLTLDLTGVSTANGYGLGFVSVNTGNPLLNRLGVHATNTTASATGTAGLSVDLTTTLESFVIAGHRSNSASGGASANAPMTQIYGAQIGSSQGAAGYQADVPAGTTTFTFTSANQARNSSAAAFVPVPEPSTALLGGLGALFLLRRRRN